MTTVAFDTLEFVETLEKAGIAREQASGIASAVRTAQETALTAFGKTAQAASTRAMEELDSKTATALLKLEHRLDSQIALVRKDIDTQVALVRKDIDTQVALVRKDMNSMESRLNTRVDVLQKDLTIKMGGMFMVAVGVILAAMKWMS